MNKKRPVHLDLSTFRFPLTAIASIIHRITGVALFVAVGILLWMLQVSVESPESFASLKTDLNDGWFLKFLLTGSLCMLVYHVIAGVKHLIMDLGFAETIEGGDLAARITLTLSVLSCAAIGVWLWV